MSVRSSAIGLAAVVVLMGAGAAQSLAGSNTVFTDDIVDGTIKHGDIKANSIGSSRFLDNSIVGTKIADNSVKGADVDERTLNLAGNCSIGMHAGTALIDGLAGEQFPFNYQEGFRRFAYNCTGGRVFVRRLSVGEYRVWFENNGALGTSATVETTLGDARIATTRHIDLDPVEIEVRVFDAAGTPADGNVAVVLW